MALVLWLGLTVAAGLLVVSVAELMSRRYANAVVCRFLQEPECDYYMVAAAERLAGALEANEPVAERLAEALDRKVPAPFITELLKEVAELAGESNGNGQDPPSFMVSRTRRVRA